MKETNKKAIRLFLIIVVLCSVVFEALIVIYQNMVYAAPLMWIPALAALFAKLKYFKGEKGALLFRKCKWRYALLGLVLPMIYLGVPYAIYWIIRPGSMHMNWGINFFATIIIGNVLSMITALGEEIGWRGFLVPRLTTVIGANTTLFVTGMIWAVWHIPVLVSGVYMPGTPLWFKVPMFIIIIGATGIIIGILTLKSKSIWPAALLHAAHNNYDQVIFDIGTVGADKKYYVSETGILTAIVCVTIAVIMYLSFQKDLKKESQHMESGV